MAKSKTTSTVAYLLLFFSLAIIYTSTREILAGTAPVPDGAPELAADLTVMCGIPLVFIAVAIFLLWRNREK